MQMTSIFDEYTQAASPSGEANSASTALDLRVELAAELPERYPGAYSRNPVPGYADPTGAVDGLRLHNARAPHYEIKHEKYEHRAIIYLKGQGHSNIEISRITGMSPVAVSNILRQPWAQEELLSIMREQGRDGIFNLIQGAALDAVNRLVIEMDNEKARPAERISAARELLDRRFGRAAQPIVHSVDQQMDKLSDEELERIVIESAGRVSS